jgi:hypothetical protein
MNGPSTHTSSSLPPPLRTVSDMSSDWRDVELSFDEAAEKIIRAHQLDGEAHDLPIVDLKTWAIAPSEGNFALVPLARHHEPKPLRHNAFSNLMGRIGAPADFIRRLPAPLQLANVNYLLSEHEDRSAATLRLRGDEVAAIVSGRYAPLDPEELVETIRTALVRGGMLDEVRVRGVASGLVDNLRLVLPSEEVAIKVGDVSALGLDITTSSFGRSAVHVTPVVWRLVCLNGLRAPERGAGMSFRHIGDGQRLRDGVAEAIPSAIVHARGVMRQWQAAVSFMITDVAKQIEDMRLLTIPERKAFEAQVMVEEGVPALPERTSLYSLVNALTASAKIAVPARRLELEAMAGEVLEQHVGRPS